MISDQRTYKADFPLGMGMLYIFQCISMSVLSNLHVYV